jgi:hypothetical protein
MSIWHTQYAQPEHLTNLSTATRSEAVADSESDKFVDSYRVKGSPDSDSDGLNFRHQPDDRTAT